MPAYCTARFFTMFAFGCVLSIFAGLLGVQRVAYAQSSAETQPSAHAHVEEIYIARSIAESSTAPTAFCAQERIGFSGANREALFTLQATVTRASDGLIIAANGKTIGSIHVCTGPTLNPATYNFYGDIHLGRTAMSGIGECHMQRADFPERGLNAVSCYLDLSGLPDPYVGGFVTTSTVKSLKSVGPETDPSGYTQSSITTIRLWKRRSESER